MKRFKINIELPKNVEKIHKIIKNDGFDIFLVGGCVRDAFLNVKPKDWDLVTNAKPDDVIKMLKNESFVTNILETGKAFGVINVITTDGEYEIATMRKDIGTGRRPDAVEFTNIATDIMRRDITINALFYDIDTFEIVDLVGGLEDLKNGVVRTVGSAEERFGEDRLRILRAIRFAGRFGSELDPATDAALQKDASLEGISGERIHDEFMKGITSAKSVKKFLVMIDKYKLFNFIFAGLSVDRNFIESSDPIIVIAGLLKENNLDLLAKTLNKLKFKDDEIKAIRFLVALLKLSPDTAVTLKKAQEHAGVSSEQMKSFGKKEGLDMKILDAFINFRLSVSGPEIMQKTGLKPGKELGQAIHKIETDKFKSFL
jgi:tRNA nucleotidyltransferase/poly(A) polymerase